MCHVLLLLHDFARQNILGHGLCTKVYGLREETDDAIMKLKTKIFLNPAILY